MLYGQDIPVTPEEDEAWKERFPLKDTARNAKEFHELLVRLTGEVFEAGE